MRRPLHEILVHGILGGLLAGALVALWFFVADLIAGQPLRTPTVLASAVLGRHVAGPDAGLVLAYSVLHFGVFAALGVAAAGLLAVTGAAPGILLGVVFGLGVLDAVHYGGLLITGAAVLNVLPVGHVLAANLFAGLALMSYLHFATREERPLGPAALRGHPLLIQGLVTGLVGAGGVALWFLLVDILQGRPFFTPAALGSVLFLGANEPGAVRVTVGIVTTYTWVHLFAFVLVGTVFVWVAERIERAPGFWLLGLIGFIVLEAVFVGTLLVLSDGVMGGLRSWTVAVANLIAIASMSAWVWRTHPELRRQMLEEPVRTEL